MRTNYTKSVTKFNGCLSRNIHQRFLAIDIKKSPKICGLRHIYEQSPILIN